MAYAVAKLDICLQILQAKLPNILHFLRNRVNSLHLESQEVRVARNFCNNLVYDLCSKYMENENHYRRGHVVTNRTKTIHRHPKSKSRLLSVTLHCSILSPFRTVYLPQKEEEQVLLISYCLHVSLFSRLEIMASSSQWEHTMQTHSVWLGKQVRDRTGIHISKIA